MNVTTSGKHTVTRTEMKVLASLAVVHGRQTFSRNVTLQKAQEFNTHYYCRSLVRRGDT